MKHRLISLILAALTLLGMTACNPADQTDDPASSGEDAVGTTVNNIFGTAEGDGRFDPEAEHGEPQLYMSNRYGDMIFTKDQNKLLYYTVDDPTRVSYLCYDPTCTHDAADPAYGENCVSSYHVYGSSENKGIIVADGYDRPGSPVLYLAYQMTERASVDGQIIEREPTYCIERFDIATGKRVKITQGIKNEIVQMATYGDRILFVAKDTLYNISKTGEGPVFEESTEGVQIRGTLENSILLSVHYSWDSMDLSKYTISEEGSTSYALYYWLSEVMVNERPGVFQKVSNEYLYFTANYEYDDPASKGETSAQHCDLYRLPLADRFKGVEPTLVLEDITATEQTICFADNTLYYRSPESEGKIAAVDLKTLEQTTVYEENGKTLELCWGFDDHVIFAETGGDEYLIGYANGDEAKVLCEQSKLPYVQPIDNTVGTTYWDSARTLPTGDQYTPPAEE